MQRERRHCDFLDLSERCCSREVYDGWRADLIRISSVRRDEAKCYARTMQLENRLLSINGDDLSPEFGSPAAIPRGEMVKGGLWYEDVMSIFFEVES